MSKTQLDGQNTLGCQKLNSNRSESNISKIEK